MTMELMDKTIIVTGASSGIGAAAAQLFAAEGANVMLGARRESALAQLVETIRQEGGTARFLAGDVTDPTYAGELVRQAEDAFGPLWGAFNNAGTVGDMGPVSEMSAENWQSVIDTNLTSAFHAAKAQVPALLRQGKGALVFTGSFVGVSNGGLPGMGAYAASKAGLVGLTQSLAADLGPDGIRINTILPGGTMTAMAGDDPDAHAFIAGLHPLRRLANPDEIAQAAMFLLSDRASFVTGASMFVDGGVSVRLA